MPQTRDGILNSMAEKIAKEIRDKHCGGSGGSTIDIESMLGDLKNTNFVKTFQQALTTGKDQ